MLHEALVLPRLLRAQIIAGRGGSSPDRGRGGWGGRGVGGGRGGWVGWGGSTASLTSESPNLFFPAADYFTGQRRSYRGVLLFGPPGTGKTLLARAVAADCGSSGPPGPSGPAAFFNVSAASLASKYRGEPERLVRCLFQMARARAPSTVFFDEVDALCSSRGAAGEHEASRRVKAELLVQMDGAATAAAAAAAAPPVLVLCATNFPWHLDEALRRRLEKRVHVPLPDARAGGALLRSALAGLPLAPGVDFAALASATAGYSGDDLAGVCRDAALGGVRRLVAGLSRDQIRLLGLRGSGAREAVTAEDLRDALGRTAPSVAPAHARRHEEWAAEFGAE